MLNYRKKYQENEQEIKNFENFTMMICHIYKGTKTFSKPDSPIMVLLFLLNIGIPVVSHFTNHLTMEA